MRATEQKRYGIGRPYLERTFGAALKTVYDPEIPAGNYGLGLIYKVGIDDDRNIAVVMTLTAPGCPVAGEMPQEKREP